MMKNQKAKKTILWILAVVFLTSVWSKNNYHNVLLSDSSLPTTDNQTKYSSNVIPGLIQAEDYDIGGATIAYFDGTTSNLGNVYRSENVDVQKTFDTGGGYNVGWIEKGEWLEYTINSISGGTYDIKLRVAAVTDTIKNLNFQLDGIDLGTASFYGTDSWQNWTTVKLRNVDIQGGNNKVLRLNMFSGGFNINWVEFVRTGQSSLSSDSKLDVTSNASSLDINASHSGLSCNINIESEWENGFVARVDVCNKGKVSKKSWTASWQFDDDSRLNNGWSSNFSGDNPYIATPLAWNSTLHPNQCVSFGFQSSKGSLDAPSTNISCN